MTSATSTRLAAAALAGLAVVLIAGCWSRSSREVIVYTALDSEFSEPIFADFEASTGIKVLPKFDTESTKTVGLARALLAERDRPRCDVFWNNEILNTIRLQQQGLIEAYPSPAAESYPPAYRSDDGAWHGFAARARVLIVNTALVSEADARDRSRTWASPSGVARRRSPSPCSARPRRTRPACSPHGATARPRTTS